MKVTRELEHESEEAAEMNEAVSISPRQFRSTPVFNRNHLVGQSVKCSPCLKHQEKQSVMGVGNWCVCGWNVIYHGGNSATYEKLNKYFVDYGTQADAMIASRQVYTLIATKFITEEETKSNTHFIQQFDRQRFQFQFEEIVNTRERRQMGKFTVRLHQRTCDYGNLKSCTCHVHM
ncbi:hypothetical protein JHK82_022684 [Glycine max]|nr:hypothetical protein JHK82_022684 [Glycine max]